MAARFDIVIPTYERPGLLVQTVESALAQTADGVRVVVADNASGPSTGEALARFGDRLEYHRFDEHVGYQQSLSRAKRLLEAPHGLILHDDDLLDADYAETALEAFARRPDVGMVICAVRPFSDGDAAIPVFLSSYRWAEALGHVPTGEGPDGPEITLAPGAFPSAVARVPSMGPYWPCVSLRRDAFVEAGAFDPELEMATDIDMWMRVGAAYPVLLTDGVHASYRFHAGSLTTELDGARREASARDMLRIFERERARRTPWRWSADESVRWLSFALFATALKGETRRRREYEHLGLDAAGVTLEELHEALLGTRLLMMQAVGRATGRRHRLAEWRCRVHLWFASRRAAAVRPGAVPPRAGV